jgi:undecaprenyl-phosphate 4-deoxy-4-formamido-L-arabinose transferase
MKTYSIVIPVFRGTKSVSKIVSEIVNMDINVIEIILVFDNGNASSWEEIKKIKNSSSLIVGLKLSRNFGQHNATLCGFNYCNSDFVITLDEDLQHNPKYIINLIEHQDLFNSDIVYGNYVFRNHNFLRNFLSSIFNKFLGFTVNNLYKKYSSFRLVKTTIAKELLNYNNSYIFIDGYFSWITSNISSIDIRHEKGFTPKSSYTFFKLLSHCFNIFLTFSDVPIKLLSLGSLTFLSFSISYFFVLIYNYVVYSNYLIGFPTIASLLCLGFSFLLFGLTILAQYLKRINLSVIKKPQFFITEII